MFGVFVKVQLILLTMKIIWIRIKMKAEETSEYWEIFDFKIFSLDVEEELKWE